MPGKNRNAPDSGRVWSLGDIQELLDLLAGKEITEFEMEQQGVRIRVRRGNPPAAGPGDANGNVASHGPAPIAAVGPTVAAVEVQPASAAPAPVASEAPAESTEGLYVMKSPIVGTFYSSPAPSAPPFVREGDIVQVGQVICIIEAMKLMNELEAEVAGRIVRTYVENGQPVEYGQSLFAIEAARK
jgi:acetyl-CoA carboxylase biotin carboxyl carrier protein